jgi:hypothetical protein
LNPDLPVDHSSPRLRLAGAIEPFFAKATKVKAVEERGILNVGFWILNGRGEEQAVTRLNQNSEEVEG